jgi:fructan beta-fructosidase
MKTFFHLTIVLLTMAVTGCQSGEKNTTATEIPTDRPYTEAHRPRFHFSPPGQWMNDPNGMVYYDGEYHLFYQHYPDSNVWGPMHWGHAISRDLVHWQNMPIALYPDSSGYIFSGSAVADLQNTSGFKKGDVDPLIAIFTYHDPAGPETGSKTYQSQAMAYSNDKGRSWTKYAGNPVVPNPGIEDFRDPKVFWYEKGRQWIMILAAQDRVRLYSSPNLKNWTFTSEFGAEWGDHGGVWECPDLFELPVEGTEESRWVMLVSINPGGPNGGSATQYFVGDLDGQTFTLDETFSETVTGEQGQWIDYGRDNYAGVTWSNIPDTDGRRIFLGWMSNWDYAEVVPTTDWRSAMTLPRTLSLQNTSKGVRLFSRPVRELEMLRGETFTLDGTTLEGRFDILTETNFAPAMMEAVLEFDMPEDGTPDFGVELSNDAGDRYRVGYNAATGQYYSDRRHAGATAFSDKFAAKLPTAPRFVEDRTLRMHLFFDVASAELFADGGATVMTNIFFPNGAFSKLQLYSESGAVEITKARFYQLNSIWNQLQ